MRIIAAYQEVGTYRGAADICGTTHKTVKAGDRTRGGRRDRGGGAGGAAAELRPGDGVGHHQGEVFGGPDLARSIRHKEISLCQ